MLPEFPNLKSIEISDKEEIEKITDKFPPYSDFNFVSMWSWNVKGEMRIGQLNNNLVVRFTDYITGEPFYSFLGDNEPNKTVETLLKISHRENIIPKLRLIPEDSIKELDRNHFDIIEDRDHFDYILSLEKLSDFDKHHIKHHASHKMHFLKMHGEYATAKILDLESIEHRGEIMSLTNIWAKNKIDQGKIFLEHLEDAVTRYLAIQNGFNNHFIAVGIFCDNKLIAFTINEIINKDYSICHFMKGDNSFKGIYSYLVGETSRFLLERGMKYINFEQDLGLPNLRQSKKTFEPVTFLKKYEITIHE